MCGPGANAGCLPHIMGSGRSTLFSACPIGHRSLGEKASNTLENDIQSDQIIYFRHPLTKQVVIAQWFQICQMR